MTLEQLEKKLKQLERKFCCYASSSSGTPPPLVEVSDEVSLGLTVDDSYDKTYVYNGIADATWSLPAIGTTGQKISVKNISAFNLTLVPTGADELFTNTNVTSLLLLEGDGYLLQDDGTYWIVF